MAINRRTEGLLIRAVLEARQGFCSGLVRRRLRKIHSARSGRERSTFICGGQNRQAAFEIR